MATGPPSTTLTMALLALCSQKCGQRSGISAMASSIAANGTIDQKGSVAPSDAAWGSAMGAHIYPVGATRRKRPTRGAGCARRVYFYKEVLDRRWRFIRPLTRGHKMT